MSSFRQTPRTFGFRRTLIVGLYAALVTGCGFTPAYKQEEAGGPTASIGAVSAVTSVEVAGEREAFILEHMLRQRLGAVYDTPHYTLAVTLEVSTREGPLIDTDRMRFIRVGMADIVLRDSETGQLVLADRTHATATWDETRWSTVNRAAFDDVNERVLTLLADQIHSLLLARTARVET